MSVPLCSVLVEMGTKRLVKLLLERGADINERTGDSGNALQVAALKGHTTLVQTLVESGADVNAQGGAVRQCAAGGFIRGAYDQIVQQLLEKGVNAQGDRYGNALQAAS